MALYICKIKYANKVFLFNSNFIGTQSKRVQNKEQHCTNAMSSLLVPATTDSDELDNLGINTSTVSIAELTFIELYAGYIICKYYYLLLTKVLNNQ